MNVLIIYDDVASGVTSTALLRQAENRADMGVNWNIKLWRLNMLKFSPTAAGAREDAAEAHLIALAVSHTRTLPPWLMDWLEQWAQHRQIAEAALALVCGKNPRVRLLRIELSRFVRRHALTLICHDRGEIGGQPSNRAANLNAPKHLEPSPFSGKVPMSDGLLVRP